MIDSGILEASDLAAAEHFYAATFGEHVPLTVRASAAPTTGFRGFTPSRNGRRALAENAGVAPDGTGSHRIVIAGGAGSFTDPDGFAREAT